MRNIIQYLKNIFIEHPKKITVISALLFTLNFMGGYGVNIDDMTRSDVMAWGFIDMMITLASTTLMFILFFCLLRQQAERGFVKVSFWAVLSSAVKAYLLCFIIGIITLQVALMLLNESELLIALNSTENSYAGYLVLLMAILIMYPFFTIACTSFSDFLITRQVKRVAIYKRIKAQSLPGVVGWWSAVKNAFSSIFTLQDPQVIIWAYLLINALHAKVGDSGYGLTSSALYTVSCMLLVAYFLRAHANAQERVSVQIKEVVNLERG